MCAYLLKDIGHGVTDRIKEYFGGISTPPLYAQFGKWYGQAWAVSAENQTMVLNPTGYPGWITGIYLSLVFSLPKDKYKIVKVSEAIDVSPEHQQYWQITLAQKEALEQKIKQSLVSISQSVADLELVLTDLQRYEEFARWLKDLESEEKEKRKRAELLLKSMFVDQVDYHVGGTGEGPGRLSMVFMRNRNIMPTIVQDFMQMESKKDLEPGGKFANIPEVEKNFLRTKWMAYEEWLKIFRSNVQRRLDDLRTLAESRKKTIEEMREWIKPTIIRYKMLKDALENPGARKSSPHNFARPIGHAVSITNIEVWAYKPFPIFEEFPVPAELRAKAWHEIHPYNRWTKEHLIFHPELGLINEYPWITEEWVRNHSKKILSDMKWESSGRYYHYYTFMPISLEKFNIRMPNGMELEDGVFQVTNWTLSANVLFTKLLEQKAREESNEIYVDEMLGLKHEIAGKPVIFYVKDKGKYRIHMDHYRKLAGSFVFKVGGESIILDEPKKMEFKSRKELENEFPDNQYALMEFKKERTRWDDVKDFFKFFGVDLRLTKFQGPYGYFSKDAANKYISKPQAKRFKGVTNIIINSMKVGQIVKPTG